MIQGIIYKYTSPVGKEYIGQTTNEAVRRNCWFNSKRYAGKLINKARRKYGANNFKYEVLYKQSYCTQRYANYDLNRREIYYIGLFNTYTNGYNMTIGGDTTLGLEMSLEAKAKLSELAKLRTGDKNPFYGKTHSKEVRIKLSNLAKKRTGVNNPFYGVKPSQKTIEIIRKANSKPVMQFTLDGEYIRTFRSAKEASNVTKLSYSGIKRCASGKFKQSCGFYWKYCSSTTIPKGSTLKRVEINSAA